PASRRSRSATTTVEPAATNASASARPMPLAAPVTTATRPGPITDALASVTPSRSDIAAGLSVAGRQVRLHCNHIATSGRRAVVRDATMAWDFETDEAFGEQLRWMREFIDTQLIPLEPIFEGLSPDEWRVVQTYLQRQVEQRGLWGAFLDPELGGPGFGQLKLALMSEIIGRCMMSMGIFGVQAPDSGNMELLAHGATDAQKERWLWPNLRGEISSAFALTEPFFAGADPTVIGTT